MRGGGAGLKNRRAAAGSFLRRDLAVVDRRFERGARAERAGVESVGRAGIANYRYVILQLHFVRVGEFQDGRILDFDLDDRNVFTLIVTLARRRAVLLDLERKRAAVGNDDVVEDLEALQLAVLIDELRVDGARVFAVLLRDLLHELAEQSLLRFVFAVVSHRHDVSVGGDVAVGTYKEAGAQADGLNVVHLRINAGR